MTKRLIVITFLLLLGAIVNVLVAWTLMNELLGRLILSETYGVYDRHVPVSEEHRSWWKAHAPPGYDLDAPFSLLVVDTYPARHSVNLQVRPSPHTLQSGHRSEAGWPFRSMSYQSWAAWSRPPGDPDLPASVDRDMIMIPAEGSIPFARARHWRLPLKPIWLGFIADSVFYASILGVLLLGPGALRRHLRRRRGRCAACGYPVGASATCTECGGPLRRKGP
jgi:hypothetical protein